MIASIRVRFGRTAWKNRASFASDIFMTGEYPAGISPE
jgi:hypothetical protein